MNEITLEALLLEMREQGRQFGQLMRREQGLPHMPEPVREGSTKKGEVAKAAGLRVWGIAEMWRLDRTVPDTSESTGRRAVTLQQFLDRIF